LNFFHLGNSYLTHTFPISIEVVMMMKAAALVVVVTMIMKAAALVEGLVLAAALGLDLVA
jgi:hypothetical protein